MLFVLGYLTIIGYYWIFGGYFGNSSLTISIFVGLRPWSIVLFCAINIIVACLLVVYIKTQAKLDNRLWRFLMFAFIIAYVGLSIAAKTPDNTISTDLHHFFSKSLFLIITFSTILTIIIAEDSLTRFLASILSAYGIFFVVSYVLKSEIFMNNILWHESAYIYAFFALTLVANRMRKIEKINLAAKTEQQNIEASVCESTE